MHKLKWITITLIGCMQIGFSQSKFSWQNMYFEFGKPSNYYHNYSVAPSANFTESDWIKTIPDNIFPLYFSAGYSFKKADIVLSTFKDAIVLENDAIHSDFKGGTTSTSDIFHFNTLHFFFHPYIFNLYERAVKVGICSDLTYAKCWGGPFDGSPEYKFWRKDGSITYKNLATRGVDFDLHNNYFFAGLSAKINYEITSNIGIWAQTGYAQGFRKIGSLPTVIVIEEPNLPTRTFTHTIESQGTRYFFQFGLSLNPFRKIKLKP
jgi:hypothetical protein